MINACVYVGYIVHMCVLSDVLFIDIPVLKAKINNGDIYKPLQILKTVHVMLFGIDQLFCIHLFYRKYHLDWV